MQLLSGHLLKFVFSGNNVFSIDKMEEYRKNTSNLMLGIIRPFFCLDSGSLAFIMVLRRQNAAFFNTNKWHAAFKDGNIPDKYLVARLAVYDSETQACEEKADVRVIATWLSLFGCYHGFLLLKRENEI